ncbi:MAG: SurA N-terminal domain-containing protein [Reichenbachiella sp.]|uniref:SurA N-terminal domain-containing protein n=1 Tax=Reichenbachiella sp. TaxID=2184521 RepID=UPI003264DE57
MAAINTLREKGGKIIVILIGFSIVAFVGADLLGPNSSLLGNSKTHVGEIAGTKISYQDFIAKQNEIEYNWTQSNRRTPTSNDQIGIRNVTWDALIAEYAFKNEFDAIGIDVTDDEIKDMVQGDNISPEIRQAFTDPQTGAFNEEQVLQYLSSLVEGTQEQRKNWANFEKNLADGRVRLKFDNLIIKTNYATEAEARFKYKTESNTAEINFLYVPFLNMADSGITVTDSELQSYLSNNENDYQKEESKTIEYVSFDVVPSAGDTALVIEEIQRMKEALINTDNDSTYAVVNSDATDAFRAYTPGQLPAVFQADNVAMGQGTFVGPVVENGSYSIYKVASMAPSDTYSARASHILFKWASDSDADKAKAKSEARGVLRQIRNGADFAEMARIHGTDGTANKGGDLGWFSDGAMVAEFQDAVYGAKRKGVLADVVESQFGYHIIDVTETKTNVVYKIAKVSLEIFVSDETRNKYFRQAEGFALDASNIEEFKKTADEKGLTIRTAANVGKNDRRISGITEGRNIVYWAFNSGSVGDVSDVFEIDDQYVVAVITSEQEKGVAALETVRIEVTDKVKNQKKAKIITDKLSKLSGSLDEMAAGYGEGANVYNMPALKLSSNSLRSVGLAPEAVGVAFSMENGEVTKPFAVDNGVLIIEMVNKLEAPEISDYESYRTQLLQQKQGRLAYNTDQAVRDLAEIKDDRYKFF